jgi:DUF4097 and DUF4098 domain-containing protein YvlB
MNCFQRSIVLVLAFAVLGASGRSAERRYEKKFPANSGGTLTVKTDCGTVKVSGSSANEVSVVVNIRGSEGEVKEFEVSAEAMGNGVTVTGRAHVKSSWFHFSSNSPDAEFVILVPKSYNLQVTTAGGDFLAGDIVGTVTGETSGGDIRLTAIEGTVHAETSGGDVTVERTKGQLRCSTSGGDIRVSSATGDVDVETSGGNIAIAAVDGQVKAETSGGDVNVNVKGANKGIYAETSGGDITIQFAKGAGAEIDASTTGGEVICDLPVTVSGRISESRVKGTVNGGGPLVRARTSGGDVRIRAGE